MRYAILVLLLAGRGLQEPAPFSWAAPQGYGPLRRESAERELWRSLRGAGGGQFLITRVALETPGALAEAIATRSREEQWRPLLASLQPSIQAWRGEWAGRPAAGSEIRFVRDQAPQAMLERFLVLADRLVVGGWEGPADELKAAAAALDGFALPADWLPPPPLDYDAERGLGPSAEVLPAPGLLRVTVEPALDFTSVRVVLEFQPDPTLGWPEDWPSTWRAPALAGEAEGPIHQDDGSHRLSYRLPLADLAATRAAGLYQTPGALAAIEPGWLSCPPPPQAAGKPEAAVTPPSWTLRLLLPAHLSALSWTAAGTEKLEDEQLRLAVSFPQLAPGRAWPFFVIGQFTRREVAGLVFQQRTGARSVAMDPPLRFLGTLRQALSGWLPSAPLDWVVATYPGCGDHQLPGLLLLDETAGWFDAPLDAPWWRGQTRRAGLAQRVAEQGLTGDGRAVGSAAPFLDASLAAYGAWRLLEAGGRGQEAAAWSTLWREHERAAPPLARPLSRIGWPDLLGPERLLTRGPLVWQAIEAGAGRARLDLLLEERLRRGGTWTSEDLRAELERLTGAEWDAFFKRHVYGREVP